MRPPCEAERKPPPSLLFVRTASSTPLAALLPFHQRCWVWRTGQRGLERITAALQYSDALHERVAAVADDSHQVEAHLALVIVDPLLYDRAHALQPVLLRVLMQRLNDKQLAL